MDVYLDQPQTGGEIGEALLAGLALGGLLVLVTGCMVIGVVLLLGHGRD